MPLPAVLYVHGGGFVAGTPDMMRASNLQLAQRRRAGGTATVSGNWLHLTGERTA